MERNTDFASNIRPRSTIIYALFDVNVEGTDGWAIRNRDARRYSYAGIDLLEEGVPLGVETTGRNIFPGMHDLSSVS